ncbi:MAG: hypothetical protein IJ909_01540 [Fibrobacter sp.]|nr:hypothetical protein [Fibrobacter sp.]
MKKILAMSAALSLVLWACGDESSSTGPDLSSASGNAESSSAGIGSSDSPVPESSGTVVSSSSTEPGSSVVTPESSSVVPGSSTVEPESSEAASGSSAAVSPSSSEKETPCQVVDNMGGSCKNSSSSGNSMVDGGSGGGDRALPPVAYMTVENDSAIFGVQNVRMPCEEISGFAGMIQQLLKPSLEVTMDDTVMNVKPVFRESSSRPDCTCVSQFTFKIKLEPPFDQATLLVIDDSNNLGNRMRIIKE